MRVDDPCSPGRSTHGTNEGVSRLRIGLKGDSSEGMVALFALTELAGNRFVADRAHVAFRVQGAFGAGPGIWLWLWLVYNNIRNLRCQVRHAAAIHEHIG